MTRNARPLLHGTKATPGARKNECRPAGHLRFWRARSFNGNTAGSLQLCYFSKRQQPYQYTSVLAR